ncbi:hypothetical protein NDU88_008137 [Pleurodeles waltl]|uniref:Uncharacterized protein n=1 Tax=Pleurodeles waltl TaxID=8319 RepID=A0AAV7SUE9_PLEWA|nr:hypothetical protein NDU88_008137 [Pleurodeles waltl]
MGKPHTAKGGPPDARLETTGEGWPEQTEEHTSLAAHTVTILEAIRDTNTSLEMQIAAEMSEEGLLRDDNKSLAD